jgi:UDPglucose 6-dehydrogenase
MMTGPVICYVGMTHLGVCSAIAAASKGFQIVSFDVEPKLIAQLEAGNLPVVEPDLDVLFRDNRKNMTFTADRAKLAACDIIYIAPDVPTDATGQSDLSTIDRLFDVAVSASRPDSVIVILSQVPPGFTRARQRAGRSIYYQVETLVFGRAVERATRPERFIVGCDDPAQALPKSLAAYLQAYKCPILPMRLESAELCKISINCCLVASVSVANTLSELCERIGADWSEIVPALKLDGRIGPHAYLSPGLGLAGGNLERDLATVMHLSEEYGTEAGIIRAFIAVNAHRKDWALRTLHEALLSHQSNARLAILGLAYKENTHSVKNSPALALIRELAPWHLSVFDPVVPASSVTHSGVEGAASALAAVQGADALAIMTPWPEFRTLSCAALAAAMRGRLVLDPYRVLDESSARAAGLDYRALGVA